MPFRQEKERKLPVRLRAQSFSEQSSIFLPVGFVPDSLAREYEIETDFASYRITSRVEGDQLHYTRDLTIQDAIIPLADYPKFEEFYDRVIQADQKPIVLVRAKE